MTHYFPGEHCVLVWMSLCIVFPQVHGRGSGFGGGCGGEQREWISVSEKNLASLSPHFCKTLPVTSHPVVYRWGSFHC